MSNNNVPTGPGWWYRAGGSIVDVDTDGDGLYYWVAGYPNALPVTDDGAWLGPVPMSGDATKNEWIQVECSSLACRGRRNGGSGFNVSILTTDIPHTAVCNECLSR